MDKIKIKQETLLNLLEYINEKEWVTLKDKEGEPYHVKIEKDDNKNIKEYTEKNYDAFHNLFYKKYEDKIFIKKQKGDNFYVDESKNHITKLSNKKFKDLNNILDNENILKIKLPNKKIKGKQNFAEDIKTLKSFEEKEFKPIAKYNDGYETSYILEKKENKNLLDKIQNIKLKKYKPTTYTIDWGKQKQQGKRIGKMVIGAMGDVSLQGKKEYTNILGSFSQEEQNEINSYLRENYEKLLYTKAREYGLNKDEALNFVLKVYN